VHSVHAAHSSAVQPSHPASGHSPQQVFGSSAFGESVAACPPLLLFPHEAKAIIAAATVIDIRIFFIAIIF
jgi:hypothetical protein